MGNKISDFDFWGRPCEKCGYDTAKTTSKFDWRCWKCGGHVQRDFSERALKKGVAFAAPPDQKQDEDERDAMQPTQQHQPDTENLDFAAWLAMGATALADGETIPNEPHFYFTRDGALRLHGRNIDELWQPTTNGAQLMPLIDQFRVSLSAPPLRGDSLGWRAVIYGSCGGDDQTHFGETASIAACRAIAATYKGDAA